MAMARKQNRIVSGALLPALVAALGAAGCVDKEKCDEALRVTREALAKEQPDIARQWRDRAWKICNDAAVTAPLDKEILDKEAELRKREEDLTKQIAEAAKKRINTAQSVWLAFDKLEEKERTLARLTAHQQKAAKMAQGLPPEYQKQIEDYNERELKKRKAAVEAAEKKK
jgi:hypothetical protein